MALPYALGKISFGYCSRCGMRYDLKKLKNLVIKTKIVDIKVCPECWEEDQPQLQLGMYPVYDPQALQYPRPDLAIQQSRSFFGWNPVYAQTINTTLNNVTVTIT